MKKHLTAALALWLLLAAALPLPTAAAPRGDILRVAYEQSNPYYAYESADGSTIGLQVDIMKAITNEMDVSRLEFYPCGSISDCILALENGEVDAVMGFPMLYDGDTSNIIISSEINTIDLCVMAPREISHQISAGILESYTAVFEHNINNYNIVSNLGARLYFVVGTQRELVDTVLAGQAQVMVCDEDCVAAIVKERKIEEKFDVIRTNVTTVGYAVAVRKGEDALLRSINDGIIRIRMSGQYEQILRRWNKGRIDPDQLVRNMMIVAVAAFAVVLVYFGFSWHLRKLLKQKIAQVKDELAGRMRQLQYESHLRNQIIEYAPSIMILCDADGNTILMNAAARKLTGIESTAQPVQSIPVVGQLVLMALQKVGNASLGPMEDVPVCFRQEMGEKRSYRCTVIETWFGDAEKGFLLIISDVTAEEARTQEMIEREKSAALSRLVAGIAHEVKNPLTGIQNFADLIITERDNPEFWGYFAEFVPKEISRISKLIESLMNYARPAKGIKTVAEVSPLIRESMYLLNTAASSASIRVNLELEDGMRIYVEQDRIKQVLINILLNSLEAVEKRQQTTPVPFPYQISVSAFRQQGDVVIRVEDQGNGMSEEELLACMDPFYTTKEKGTGLGLAISRQFVQENGGTMHIDSIKEEGTTIVLRFKEIAYEQEDPDHR